MKTKPYKALFAFLTGSRVYGKPKKSSDVDLVVFVTKHDLRLLYKLSDKETRGSSTDECGSSVRFGKLNLIAVTNESDWDLWLSGTHQLQALAGDGILTKRITKERAASHFKNLVQQRQDKRRLAKRKKRNAK